MKSRRSSIHITSSEVSIHIESDKCDHIEPIIDCSVVRSDVWLFIDRECDPRFQARFLAHIENCEHCVDVYSAEVAVKGLINKCCSGAAAPAHLLDSICRELFGDSFKG